MHKTKRSRTEMMPGIKAASFDSLGLSGNKRHNDRRRRGDEACRRRALLHWLEKIDAVFEADEQWRIAKRCQAATRKIANRHPSRDGTSRMNREVGADQRSHHDHGGARGAHACEHDAREEHPGIADRVAGRHEMPTNIGTF